MYNSLFNYQLLVGEPHCHRLLVVLGQWNGAGERQVITLTRGNWNDEPHIKGKSVSL